MIFQSFNLITRTTVIKNVLTAFVPDLPWWRATFGIFTKEEKMKALHLILRQQCGRDFPVPEASLDSVLVMRLQASSMSAKCSKG